ncbi:TPA: hypothetical protein N0F65_006451 [Lagenidium giganteum]|uniref:DUF6818 domain-containing protein n=1 Tax=Lagenidium giganteum TaxID=4803 RepID=A0AAV2Z1K5_9STRA|nr:TPA: hypothetical protein N0F65_006451 [Lagenidium giganteum]
MTSTKTKGKNFRTQEICRKCSLPKAQLPFGQERWECVASKYNENVPGGWPQRDGPSLKQKFQKLVRVGKPTGRGQCPAEIQRAKLAQRQIESEISVVCTTMTMAMTMVTRTMVGMKMTVRMNRLWQATAFSVQPMLIYTTYLVDLVSFSQSQRGHRRHIGVSNTVSNWPEIRTWCIVSIRMRSFLEVPY